MKTFSNILSKAPDAARDYVEGRKVDEVECIVSDLPGIARGKAVPAQKFLRQKTFEVSSLIKRKLSFLFQDRLLKFLYWLLL